MPRVNFPLTVEELAIACANQIEKGNAKKYVLIGDDEEGNGYHECYFQFSELTPNNVAYLNMPYDLEFEDCVFLG